MVKIDKNIPLPSFSRGRKRIYPFKEMKVGDSFLGNPGRQSLYASAIQATFLYKPKKFVARKVKEGFRIWRIK